MTRYTFDAVIIGGGIAGLWTLNRLCNQGFNAILLEEKALGSDQTIASQGMIHGGIKYALGGALTRASEAIADMPDHWRACLRGDGDVDLTGSQILSDHFYLWSTTAVRSRLSGFLASKAIRGRVEKVLSSEMPAIFAHREFRGTLYRLTDMVVDTTSVLQKLANNYIDRIFSINWSHCRWRQTAAGPFLLTMETAESQCEIAAGAFIFCAGKGNASLLNAVGASTPAMQLRPLQQVMVRPRFSSSFYGHCITNSKTPILTISSHRLDDENQVWYLGGALAEKLVGQAPAQIIVAVQRELKHLLPWLDFTGADWATLQVERAEPRQRNLVRPDNAYAEWARGPKNIIAAWPTKLTLAPHLAAEVERLIRGRGLSPGSPPPASLPLAKPEIARPPWEEAFAGVR